MAPVHPLSQLQGGAVLPHGSPCLLCGSRDVTKPLPRSQGPSLFVTSLRQPSRGTGRAASEVTPGTQRFAGA